MPLPLHLTKVRTPFLSLETPFLINKDLPVAALGVMAEAAAADLPPAPPAKKGRRKVTTPSATPVPADPSHMDARDRMIQQAERDAPHRAALDKLIPDSFVGKTPDAKAIREIQKHLNALGIDAGKVDGDLGPKTAQAIVAYVGAKDQFDLRADLFKNGLTLVDDIVKIGAEAERGEPLSPRDVLMVQLKMKMTGHPPVSRLSDFDGKAGPQTMGVLSELRSRYLPKDGALTERDTGLRTLAARLQETMDAGREPVTVAAAPTSRGVDRAAADAATRRLVERATRGDAQDTALAAAPAAPKPTEAPAAATAAVAQVAPQDSWQEGYLKSRKPAEPAADAPAVTTTVGDVPAAVRDGGGLPIRSATFRDSPALAAAASASPVASAPATPKDVVVKPTVPDGYAPVKAGSGDVMSGVSGTPVIARATEPPTVTPPAVPVPEIPRPTAPVTALGSGNEVKDRYERPVVTARSDRPEDLQPIAPTTDAMRPARPDLSGTAPLANNLPRDTGTAGLYAPTMPPLASGPSVNPPAAVVRPPTRPSVAPGPSVIVDSDGRNILDGSRETPVRPGISGRPVVKEPGAPADPLEKLAVSIAPPAYVQGLGQSPILPNTVIPVITAPDKPMAVPSVQAAPENRALSTPRGGAGAADLARDLALTGVPDPATYAAALRGAPTLSADAQERVLTTWDQNRQERNVAAALEKAETVISGFAPSAPQNHGWMNSPRPTYAAVSAPPAAPKAGRAEPKREKPSRYQTAKDAVVGTVLKVADYVLSAVTMSGTADAKERSSLIKDTRRVLEETLQIKLQAESSGGVNNYNPKTGVRGAFQFQPETYTAVVDKHYRGFVQVLKKAGIKDTSRESILANINNPVHNAVAAAFYTFDNTERIARKHGADAVNPATLYLAHMQPEKVVAMLTALKDRPNASVLEVIGESAARSNAHLFYHDPATKRRPLSVKETFERFQSYAEEKAAEASRKTGRDLSRSTEKGAGYIDAVTAGAAPNSTGIGDLALPVALREDKPVSSEQDGYRFHPKGRGVRPHEGVDLPQKAGTPIVAPVSGEIFRIGYDRNGYGHYVDLLHKTEAGEYYTLRFAHGQKRPNGKVGDAVDVGSVIMFVGNTGGSTAPHLHLEMRKQGTERPRSHDDGVILDPLEFIDPTNSAAAHEALHRKEEAAQAARHAAAARRGKGHAPHTGGYGSTPRGDHSVVRESEIETRHRPHHHKGPDKNAFIEEPTAVPIAQPRPAPAKVASLDHNNPFSG